MMNIKNLLHEKRSATEVHIKELENAGKAGQRYTATMLDIPFLILGILCDFGWIAQLVAGILYFCKSGFSGAIDVLILSGLIITMIGVGWIIYLNRIHEKEIATRLQKNLSFGFTPLGGLISGVFGIVQICMIDAAPTLLIWSVAGGMANFLFGLPLYLSFKKGIIYGVQ